MMQRRQFFQVTSTIAATGVLAGCASFLGEDEDQISDSDGDGVIDSEDYAPSDPDVQRKSDLATQSSPTETSTPTPNPSIDISARDGIKSDRNQISARVDLDGADKIEFKHNNETIGTFTENKFKVFHELNDKPTVKNTENITIYGYWGGEKHQLEEKMIIGT